MSLYSFYCQGGCIVQYDLTKLEAVMTLHHKWQLWQHADLEQHTACVLCGIVINCLCVSGLRRLCMAAQRLIEHPIVSMGKGGQVGVFMEKVYGSSKWWEVKDWGESVSELGIVGNKDQ